MNHSTVVLLNDAPAQPWRNGGGTTRELFVWPTGPSSSTWQVRISVADIEANGPFSAFPGVDRHFAVAQGEGVSLQWSGGPPSLLTPHSPPLAFDGGLPPDCRLLGGPTRDLNLMGQRHAGTARMVDARRNPRFASHAPVQALFSTAAVQVHAQVHAQGQVRSHGPLTLPAWSLLVWLGGQAMAWQIQPEPDQPPAPAWWMDFTPHDSAARTP